MVVLTTPGHWVIGALANNQWSYAGWGKSNVDALLIQPFTNYNFPGWLVRDQFADHNGKLVGCQQQPLDTADWRRCRQNCQVR